MKMYSTLNVLKKYDHLGQMHLNDGTLLIGKAPHLAPSAWLHVFFPPLTDREIYELESNIKIPFPDVYKTFLKITNGLRVFNTTFCLDGLRRSYDRTGNDMWQPFDTLTTNILERPENAEKNILFIGGYDWDGSLLYIDNITNKVHLCARYDARALYTWKCFEDMLNSEINRLMSLFDEDGKELNPEISTLPNCM